MPSTFKQWKKLATVILQNTEKISMKKAASKNISHLKKYPNIHEPEIDNFRWPIVPQK